MPHLFPSFWRWLLPNGDAINNQDMNLILEEHGPTCFPSLPSLVLCAYVTQFIRTEEKKREIGFNQNNQELSKKMTKLYNHKEKETMKV